MRDWLSKRASLSPEKTALIFEDQELSYAQLNDWVNVVARKFQEQGVGQVAHVGVLLLNTPIHIVVIHALARLGAIVVPLNIRLIANELGWQLAQSDCEVVIICDDTSDLLGADNINNLETISVDDLGWSSVAALKPPLETESADISLDSVQGIFFTSGTTGRPKGAMLTFNNHMCSAMGSAYRLQHLESDRWLLVIPLYHIGGQAIVFRASLYGITIVLQEKFDAEDLYQSLLQHKVSVVSLVPTMLQRMMPNFKERGLPNELRCILLGGANASRKMVDECIENNIPIALTYGLTEATSQVATASPAQVRVNPGCVGKPLMTAELQILAEDGRECEANEVGEIVVGGEIVMQGYYQDEQGMETTLIDGKLHSGDLGYLDEFGDLWVVSRRADLIVSGGENIYPAEVENVLLSHPAVAEACVVGVEDQEWGQSVVALVVKNASDVTEQELIAFCRKNLGGYKLPKMIRFVDQFARTASGKIIRDEVKKQFELITSA